MKFNFKRTVAVVMVVAMLALSLASCNTLKGPGKSTIETPLVVAYDPFNGKFSPFYADTAYDQDVASMTQLSLLTTDRQGGIVYNAINGETIKYNGKDYKYTGIANIKVTIDDNTGETTYRAELKRGVQFSDGKEMTADDIIFTYYVYLDPAYVGSTTLSSYDIKGAKNYMTQTTDAVYEKYEKLADDILKAGSGHKWASTDAWTEDLQKAYWDVCIKDAWKAACQDIVTYCATKYASSYASEIGSTGEEISASEGLQVAFGMVMWGFGEYSDNTVTTSDGKKFDLSKKEYPTIEDYYNATYVAYEGDPVKFFSVEAADSSKPSVVANAKNAFILNYGSKDEAMGTEGIKNISGIKKIDNYTVEVVTASYEAPAIYAIFGISVAPLHYYGDVSKYDYANNKFGHDFGNLDSVQAKTSNPMGAGPYKFVKYEDKVVFFESNEYYYKGCPKIHYIQFREIAEADKISTIPEGKIDISNPSGNKTKFNEIRTHNSNGELTGDKIITSSVDNLGYGYIGINADTVRVGNDSASTASKNLRKAFATLFAVYRDVAINSYYGDAAAVINYPISNTSWAAPQKSDVDYKVAFSVDVNGKDIYTSDMDANAKYVAALNAAKDYFIAAGYTFDSNTGKFTAAPEGAKLSYEFLIPGDGKGDHPNFQIATNVSNALKALGITLTVTDLAESSVLWDTLDAGTHEFWTAAWGSTIDPDMYQVYHSSGIVGRNGSDSNHYHIDDKTLDENILKARKSADQSYRKQVYKSCLDIIIDWAVEIPSYQRQNIVCFSAERVKADTITPDITTYWGWMNDIELLEVVETASTPAA